jgi:RES domain-containing protein
VKFWRICRSRYAASARSGEGARLYGGRWNSRGVAVIYASTSLALATIEILVNLEPQLQPSDLVSIEGAIPDDLEVERINPTTLPRNWRQTRRSSMRALGDRWVRENQTVALLVPSAPIAGEWNVLLNPLHTNFARVIFGRPARFSFDPRMFHKG